MGSYASPSGSCESTDEFDEESVKLGDLLSGRLADVAIDSVGAVREERERE